MLSVVGRNVLRKNGMAKAAGHARFVDDLSLPGMLYGRAIRSTIPAGRGTSLRYAFDTTGFTTVTAGDIPGRNTVALILDDQPCLADGEIRHAAEPSALIAHEDAERVRAAAVDITYTVNVPVFDPRQSHAVFKKVEVTKGHIDTAFRRADLIVEGEYRTGHQEHLYIEPNGMLAVPGDGGVTVYGSLQCPYYVQHSLCVLLGLPASKVRVVQAETGGCARAGPGGLPSGGAPRSQCFVSSSDFREDMEPAVGPEPTTH